jgi:hypothetical protein
MRNAELMVEECGNAGVWECGRVGVWTSKVEDVGEVEVWLHVEYDAEQGGYDAGLYVEGFRI